MTRILLARIVLALAGIGVWFYGVTVDDQRLRWAGIAILAVSLVLRFVPRRFLGQDERPRE